MDQAASIEAFFQEKVDRAMRDKGLSAGTMTEHYLVRLLAAYASHPIDDAPLGVKLLEALGAAPRERRLQLREVGDTSLFLSGFWSESLAGKPVDVDYYVGIGGSAYGELARASAGWVRDPYGNVYEELSENFARFVDVLAIVSRWLMPQSSPQDVVRLYERWKATGSAWAAKRLAALGVVAQNGGGRPQ